MPRDKLQYLEITEPSTNETETISFYVRPFVQECLRAVNMEYEVAIFTIGTDWYANPIIEMLDPDGTFIQHRFFRQHAIEFEHNEKEFLVKDLNIFEGLDLNNVLFVDNQVFSFAANLKNGIPIVDFQGQKDDSELIKLMLYVHSIANSENLRDANEECFGFNKLLNSNIEKFIKYYKYEELSENNESDFNADGTSYDNIVFDEDQLTPSEMNRSSECSFPLQQTQQTQSKIKLPVDRQKSH